MRIVVLALACMSFMAFGLYAGKKRERGLGWIKIAYDLAVDAFRSVSAVFRAVSSPFRKGTKDHDGCGEAVEPEVA